MNESMENNSDMANKNEEKLKEEALKNENKPFSENKLNQPQQPDPPTLSVGEEFVIWAETYWQLKLKYSDSSDSLGESSSYKYMREIFIKKINGLLEERLL